MPDQTNSEYFAARAVEHRKLSQTTADARAAAIHAELSARYAELSLEFDAKSLQRSATG